MITTILQPAFLPWLGYVAMVNASDTFVFYDDVQFFRWFVNRNKIKFQNQEKWLSVPVIGHRQPINETKICYAQDWASSHLETLKHGYSKAANFKQGFELARDVYRKFDTISELAVHSVRTICDYLDIKTKFVLSSGMGMPDTGKTERLVEICHSLRTSVYLTGFGSNNYIDPQRFEERGMHMMFYKYEQKPHQQVGENFLPFMSSLDAIMNCRQEDVKAMINLKKVLCLQRELA